MPLIREGAHAKDTPPSLDIFIPYKSEIVILRYRFSFFLLAVYHQHAYISRVLRSVVNPGTAEPGDSSIKLGDSVIQTGAASRVIHAQLLNTDPDGRNECVPEGCDENLWTKEP